MNVFKTDYSDLVAVKRLAEKLHRRGFTQFVTKHRDRSNFNITMQKGLTVGPGVNLVGQFDGRWSFPEGLPVVHYESLPDGGVKTWAEVEGVGRVDKLLSAGEWERLRSLEGDGFRLKAA